VAARSAVLALSEDVAAVATGVGVAVASDVPAVSGDGMAAIATVVADAPAGSGVLRERIGSRVRPASAAGLSQGVLTSTAGAVATASNGVIFSAGKLKGASGRTALSVIVLLVASTGASATVGEPPVAGGVLAVAAGGGASGVMVLSATVLLVVATGAVVSAVGVPTAAMGAAAAQCPEIMFSSVTAKL